MRGSVLLLYNGGIFSSVAALAAIVPQVLIYINCSEVRSRYKMPNVLEKMSASQNI